MKKFLVFGLILVAMTGALMTSCDDGSTTVVEKVYNTTLVPQDTRISNAQFVDSGYYLLKEDYDKSKLAKEEVVARTLQEAVGLLGLTKPPSGLEDDLATGRVALLIYSSALKLNLTPASGYLLIWE
ncbi:MAG: hypothetical protein MdMp014T_0797 [Treponematales bacterium]